MALPYSTGCQTADQILYSIVLAMDICTRDSARSIDDARRDISMLVQGLSTNGHYANISPPSRGYHQPAAAKPLLYTRSVDKNTGRHSRPANNLSPKNNHHRKPLKIVKVKRDGHLTHQTLPYRRHSMLFRQ